MKSELEPQSGYSPSFTISPEFNLGTTEDDRDYASESMVYSHKVELSKEDVERIAEVKTYFD